MEKVQLSFRMTGLMLGTAMAGFLLSGCATGGAAPRAEAAATAAQAAMAEGRQERAIALAERAVAAEPHNAAYRAVLGKAYLDAGRFASAQTAFDDAMLLGDSSPRTALSLALALTAQAKYAEAAAVLNDWQDRIAPADLGLALALVGQPDRGIQIMVNAIRSGDQSVKMRQNLAFAYAVAGRWREARLMASQDLPADQVGARMEQWASLASADAYQLRVAGLLGVPAGVRDPGQPVHLALSNIPSPAQLAAETGRGADAATAPAEAETMTIPASGSELPAVGRAALDIASTPVRKPAQASSFTQAFSEETMAPPAMDAGRIASAFSTATPPPAQVVTNRYAAVSPAAAAAASTPTSRSAAASRQQTLAIPGAIERTAADGTHLVQLGSFSSEQGARRAWGIYISRYPELANHEMVITEAVVNGRRYYRVSAGGFDRSTSRAMCNRVRAARGDGCISWAAASPLPGAVDNGIRLARR